jgi:cytokinin riboside 5'-monophosphate phosphoribohydrolase
MEVPESSHRGQAFPFKTICVLGGLKLSSETNNIDIASKLVQEFGAHNINIIYGGTDKRLFGSLLIAARYWGIEVSNIPFEKVATSAVKSSTGLKLQAKSILDYIVHMVNNCDAFIILPGGYDTLNAIFSITSWAEWNFHAKPIGLLNLNNFFDGLISFLDRAVDHRFISRIAREILISADTVGGLLIKFCVFVLVQNFRSYDSQTICVMKRNVDPLDLSL